MVLSLSFVILKTEFTQAQAVMPTAPETPCHLQEFINLIQARPIVDGQSVQVLAEFGGKTKCYAVLYHNHCISDFLQRVNNYKQFALSSEAFSQFLQSYQKYLAEDTETYWVYETSAETEATEGMFANVLLMKRWNGEEPDQTVRINDRDFAKIAEKEEAIKIGQQRYATQSTLCSFSTLGDDDFAGKMKELDAYAASQ